MNQSFRNDNGLLTGTELKTQARNALYNNLGKAVLAFFLAVIIEFAATLLIEFAALLLYSFFIVIREVFCNGLTVSEVQLLVSDPVAMQPYLNWSTILDYAVVTITSIFGNIFSVGIAFVALKLACGRPFQVTDIFYGYHKNFKKSLQLSTVFVLVGLLTSLPKTVASFLWDMNADWSIICIVLIVYFIGFCIYVPIHYSITQAYFLMLDFPDYSAGQLIKLSSHIMKGHKFRFFLLELSFLPLLLLSFLTFGIGLLWVNPYMQITYAFFFLNLMQARESANHSAPRSPMC